MSESQSETDKSVDYDPFAGSAILSTAPCTEPQRELWTSCQLGDDASLAFNESVSVWLDGELDEGALRTALMDLVERHEALSMSFTAGGLTFEVHPPSTPFFLRHDWSRLEPVERVVQLGALRARVVNEPFDLTIGPLFRVELAVLSSSQHVLTMTAHHIVVDGWSTAVLVRDLAALYTARVTHAAVELPPAERFSVYARAEAERLRHDQFAAHEAYWTGRFSGELPVLELPSDHPRPPVKTYASAREDVTLEAALVAAVKKVGAKERASLFVTLMGAFEVLLHRIAGQEDIVVGIPAAGQSAGGHDTLVGHCVNLLPVRTRVHGGQTFTELLASLRTAVLDAYEHQEFTFGTLLKKLPIARDPSRLPLVQVIFNVDRGMSPETMPFHGLTAELRSNPRAFENFDLFLNAVEIGGQVVLECQYNTDLYEQRTIQRRLAAFEQVLRAIVADPARKIGDLPIVSAEEVADISRWNQSAQERPAGMRVHDLIAAQVARSPEAVAIEVDGVPMSYSELERRANQVARRLRSLGVKRGDFVGLCIERSFDMFVGLYGALKAGAAYVPLDPGFPLERLAYMVGDAKMSIVLTQAKVHSELKLAAEHLILLDADAALAGESAAPLAASTLDARSDDPSYVIYTSGSTGKPKGVVLSHRALVNLLMSVQREPGMTAADVVLAVTTLSFDIATSEIILPLTVGAKIVLASRDVAADGARLLALLRSRKVTFVDATPATWRLLIAAGWDGGEGLRVICTGEALPKDLALALLARCKEVWNGYGPSETCVWSTFWRVPAEFGRVLIGHPVANTTCHILDARLQPVPVGVPGELFIGGDGVALGYLGRPDLTAERFLPDPSRQGHKMYKTGDLVRWLPSGELECLGRNDNQVKLRGFRIELGEIEDALNQHPAVKQAAVIKREDRPGDQRLVGYMTFHADESASKSELRTHLKQRLPDYMIPQAFVTLPKMPLTPSGKIDRRSLPEPLAGGVEHREDFVAPRTSAEELVASLWREALGLPRISVDDDFFALGGHSLLASQILARLRRDHGVELSFRKMFEAPTVAQFSELVETSGNTASKDLPITRRGGSGPTPTSLAQERMVLLELLEPSRAVAHNLPAAWRMKGRLDIPALQRALDTLVQRHETLRTTFRMEDGRPIQVIHPPGPQPLPVVDLTGHADADREQAAIAFGDARTLEPTDFGKGPLFRTWLLHLGDDDHVLSILPHNTIWDGWSFDLFLKEVTAHYLAFSAGAAPLPALPITYSDYAIWQRASLTGPQFTRQVEFWRKQLAGSPPALEIPLDWPRPTVNEHRGADEVLKFSIAELEAFTALGRAHGATLFMVLFAGYNALLHRVTGLSDVTIGAPTRARSRPEFEDLIGPFVNSVVLRTQVDASLSFGQLVERVRDVTLEAFNYQDMPLEALGVKPPVVRNYFSLQDARSRPLHMGGLILSQVHVLPPAAQADTMIWFMEGKEGLFAVLNFNTALFERSTAARLLRGLRTLLLQAALTPEATVGDLPVAADEDRTALDDFAVSTGSVLPRGTLVDVLSRSSTEFEVVRGSQPLTRQAFQDASTDLVAALAGAGLRAGGRVGLHLEAGRDLIVGLAGTLRAGGVVASLDVTCSKEVLRSQIQDAELAIIITRRDQFNVVDGLAPLVICLGELPTARADTDTTPVANEPALLLPVPCADGIHWAAGSHSYFINVLAALTSAGAISAADTVAAVNPAGHELATLETLIAACSTALATAAADVDPIEALDLPSATVALVPTSRLESLATSGWKGNTRLKIVAVGPTPSRVLQEALLARCAGLWHAWGHPSVGTVLTLRHVKSVDARALLGRPAAGVRLEVLDARGKPQPQGTTGTVCVSGTMFPAAVSLAIRGRWTVDGQLEVAPGNAMEAFHLGWRFMPAEIEHALASHEAVARAAVEVRHGDGGEELVAYVVRKGSEEFTTTELRRHLRRSFPRRLVPTTVIEVQELPESAPGVVDRLRLQILDPDRGARFIAPSTPSEQLVANLWQETLGLSGVSATDKFFDIGGYSLLCFQIIGRIEHETGKRLHPRSFVLDTLRQLASQLD